LCTTLRKLAQGKRWLDRLMLSLSHQGDSAKGRYNVRQYQIEIEGRITTAASNSKASALSAVRSAFLKLGYPRPTRVEGLTEFLAAPGEQQVKPLRPNDNPPVFEGARWERRLCVAVVEGRNIRTEFVMRECKPVWWTRGWTNAEAAEIARVKAEEAAQAERAKGYYQSAEMSSDDAAKNVD
jgi:hypothetical protein